jgi:hypothetical protein
LEAPFLKFLLFFRSEELEASCCDLHDRLIREVSLHKRV